MESSQLKHLISLDFNLSIDDFFHNTLLCKEYIHLFIMQYNQAMSFEDRTSYHIFEGKPFITNTGILCEK